MPDLVRWQREYRGRGLRVIGVTYPPTERSKVRRFIRSLRVNYPIVLGTKETKALFDQGETLPITVVVDREGNIRETIEGILLPEEFEEIIKPLFKPLSLDGNGASKTGKHYSGTTARHSLHRFSFRYGIHELLLEFSPLPT